MTSPSPISNPGEWVEYCNEITQRWVGRATKVIDEAADKLSTGTQPVQTWLNAVNELADLALIHGGELAATIFAGPGFNKLPPVTPSGWYNVPSGASGQYCLKVSDSKPLHRFVSQDPISPRRIRFEAKVAGECKPCPGGTLPMGATQFRLIVDRVGIHSGCYTGEVLLVPVSGTGAPICVAVDLEL